MHHVGALVYFHREGQSFISPVILSRRVISNFIHAVTYIGALYCWIIYKAEPVIIGKQSPRVSGPGPSCNANGVCHSQMYVSSLLKFKCSFLGISSSLAKRPVEWMRSLILLCVTRQKKKVCELRNQVERLPTRPSVYLALNTTSEKQYRRKKHLHAIPFHLKCPPHDTSLELCWDAAEPLIDGG